MTSRTETFRVYRLTIGDTIDVPASDWQAALEIVNRPDACIVMHYPLPKRPDAIAAIRLMDDGPRYLPCFYVSDTSEDALAAAARHIRACQPTGNRQQPTQQNATKATQKSHRREAKENA